MHEFGVVADFGANGPTCERIDVGATDFDNMLILDHDGETTCISTIEGTDAREGV
jgi:hypothetical protein